MISLNLNHICNNLKVSLGLRPQFYAGRTWENYTSSLKKFDNTIDLVIKATYAAFALIPVIIITALDYLINTDISHKISTTLNFGLVAKDAKSKDYSMTTKVALTALAVGGFYVIGSTFLKPANPIYKSNLLPEEFDKSSEIVNLKSFLDSLTTILKKNDLNPISQKIENLSDKLPDLFKKEHSLDLSISNFLADIKIQVARILEPIDRSKLSKILENVEKKPIFLKDLFELTELYKALGKYKKNIFKEELFPGFTTEMNLVTHIFNGLLKFKDYLPAVELINFFYADELENTTMVQSMKKIISNLNHSSQYDKAAKIIKELKYEGGEELKLLL